MAASSSQPVSPIGLNDLPEDIIFQIADHLSLEEMAQLHGTSPALRDTITSLIKSNFQILNSTPALAEVMTRLSREFSPLMPQLATSSQLSSEHDPVHSIEDIVAAHPFKALKRFNQIVRRVLFEGQHDLTKIPHGQYAGTAQVAQLKAILQAENAEQKEKESKALVSSWPRLKSALQEAGIEGIPDSTELTADAIRSILENASKNPHIENVHALDLSGLSLEAVPSELSLFRGLMRLDLSNNALTSFKGSDQWRRLETLIIHHNALKSFAGSDKWIHLKNLDLSHNALPVFLPKSSWQRLESVDITHNPIKAVPKIRCGNYRYIARIDGHQHNVAFGPGEGGALFDLADKTARVEAEGRSVMYNYPNIGYRSIAETIAYFKSKMLLPISAIPANTLAYLYTKLINQAPEYFPEFFQGPVIDRETRALYESLPEKSQTLINYHIWVLSGKPTGEDNYGGNHVFDDKAKFYAAVHNAIVGQWSDIANVQSSQSPESRRSFAQVRKGGSKGGVQKMALNSFRFESLRESPLMRINSTSLSYIERKWGLKMGLSPENDELIMRYAASLTELERRFPGSSVYHRPPLRITQRCEIIRGRPYYTRVPTHFKVAPIKCDREDLFGFKKGDLIGMRDIQSGKVYLLHTMPELTQGTAGGRPMLVDTDGIFYELERHIYYEFVSDSDSTSDK